MELSEAIKIIREYENPYPEDIFLWDNDNTKEVSEGRFNEFIHYVVENTRDGIIKLLEES